MALRSVKSFYEQTSKEKLQKLVEEDLDKNTDFIFSIINEQYTRYKNVLSKNELKSKITEIIKDTKFGKTGYFFVADLNNKIIAHPVDSKLEGKDFSNVKDKNGIVFIKALTDKIKAGKSDSFISYVWEKPKTKELETKISYGRLFEPFN